MTDEELLRGFESCALAPADFGHREHLRIAWLYLRGATFLEAAARFRASLLRFAEAHGKRGLYHETITLAYLALVQERMHGAPALDFDAFARENADLFDHERGALSRLYDRETLRSDRARAIFVLPRGGVSPATPASSSAPGRSRP